MAMYTNPSNLITGTLEPQLIGSESRAEKAQFNAFVPPASVDWMAYEWRPGDFIRHFAGCPWQETQPRKVGAEFLVMYHGPYDPKCCTKDWVNG